MIPDKMISDNLSRLIPRHRFDGNLKNFLSNWSLSLSDNPHNYERINFFRHTKQEIEIFTRVDYRNNLSSHLSNLTLSLNQMHFTLAKSQFLS